jgi:hypothetical protein
MVRWVTAILLLPAPALAADDFLPRFRARLEQALKRLPDYTCEETIARSRRASDRVAFEAKDTIRVHVGLVAGKEKYSWPDAKQFEDKELRAMVGRGIIGSGNFAAHVQHVFLSQATQFTARGEVEDGGRKLVRYDYELAVEYSHYKLRIAPLETEVGVKGFFLADTATMALIRLEVLADEIPPEMGTDKVHHSIEYAPTEIGGGEYLLPLAAQLTLTDLNGAQHRNDIRFSGCRQYRVESTVQFDGEPGPASKSAAGAAPAAVSIPANLLVEVALDNDIHPETAAIGDSVRAVVTKPARDETRVVIAEGAVVHGRLVRIERGNLPFDHYVVGMEFHTIELGGGKVDFFATLQDAGPASGLLRQAKRMDPVFSKKRNTRFDILVREKPRGEGVLHWDAKHAPIRRGLKMRWITSTAAKIAELKQ